MAARSVPKAKTWLELGTVRVETPAAKTLASQASTNGLPPIEKLTALANAAIALKLTAAPAGRGGRAQMGISFTVAEVQCVGTVYTAHPIYKDFVGQPSVGKCCENMVFPVARTKGGDLVVKQSKAPCAVCLHAFTQYSLQEKCTIIVQTESPTDKTTLVFSQTGYFFPQS